MKKWLKGERVMEIKNKITMEQASSYMVLVLVSTVLMEKLDDLKYTNIWSGKLKVAGDQFRIQAEKLLRQELHKHFGRMKSYPRIS